MGWALLPGGSIAATLQKINGLAWQTQLLANETEVALGTIDRELSALRTAVLQQRLILDTIIAKERGVCKVLGTDCCFYIPDAHHNLICEKGE
uniref:Tektin n=1 Tax=Electrophorus electricus TaxID=8005 RepID=A0AAY5EFX3_ELEEL